MPIYNFPSASGGKVMKSQVFTANGTFTPATGVTEVYITACGAGGGGGGGAYDGTSASDGGTGGVTSFGALKTLSGGSGGEQGRASRGGNGGAGAGLGGCGGSGGGGGQYNMCDGGYGGSGLFNGPGVMISMKYDSSDRFSSAPGCGGYGGFATIGNSGAGGGGGAGDFCIDYPLTVVPGTNYTITLGVGGTYGSRYGSLSSDGGIGGSGYMLIKWWE